MHIFQLSPEVVNMIVHECNGDGDWKRLRSVNKIFKNFVDPLLFGKFRIYLRSPLYGKTVEQIKALAADTTVASICARDLTIASLSLKYKNDPTSLLRSTYNYANSEARYQKFNEIIPDAISSFTNLRSVDWTLRKVDDVTVTEAVMMHFGRLTTLKTFKLELEQGVTLPRNIVYLQDLKSLTITATPTGDEASLKAFVHRLAYVIGNCPKLEYLELDFNQADCPQFPVIYLSWLFKRLDASSPLPLRELKLRHVAFDITADGVVKHLRNLRSLSILNDANREEVDVLGGDENTPYVVNFDHGPRWAVLKKGKVRLQNLTVDEITDGLLEYLASYSGLVSLNLSHIRTIRKKPIAKWAKTFYKSVLPKHINTLHTLTIEPEFQTGWCFDEASKMFESILKCKKLRTLRLTWDPQNDDKKFKGLYTILDIAGKLKHLNDFSIRVACPLGLRNEPASVQEDYVHQMNPMLMILVPGYDRPDAKKHPQCISVGELNFSLVDKSRAGNSKKKLWRYRLEFSGWKGRNSVWVK